MHQLQPEKKRLCFEVSPVWTIVFLFIVMGLIFFAIAIGGIFGPDSIEIVKATDSQGREEILEFPPEIWKDTLQGQEISGTFDDLSVFNDEILFTVVFFKNSSLQSFGFQDMMEMKIGVEGSNDDVKWEEVAPLDKTHTRELTCPQDSLTCQPLTLFQLTKISFKKYKATIKIINQGKQADMNLFQPKLFFSYASMNDTFVKLEIAFRYIFLFFNVAILALFLIFTRYKQPFSLWHTEQKWIAFVLFFLILYNNPIYVLQYLSDLWLFNLLNILFKVTYIAILLFSFLVFTHSIYTKEENRGVFSFYFPKGILVITLWILTVVSFILVSITKKYDIAYAFEELAYHNYIAASIVTLLGVYILLLLYYIVRGIGMMKDLPTKYSAKFKIVYGVTLFVLVVAIAASVISYSFGKLTSFLFLATLALLNLWPFALAIFFLPSNEKHIGEDKDEIRILQGADEEDDEELVVQDEDEEQ
ncbi:hypothetical protein FDP41_008988 [Naegleria fowleri]|uniref:Uncharacterized protein n=1 Tax=Naegleria fowleri TaxID=5763 RepID=A0A6A5BI84_NAEFO|nr:uncharacterized protein FDP41_008988 [Naegleria fowleri]KAF0972739.1 hypothetical protein FDP41_008988 [Naegleria fowleri]